MSKCICLLTQLPGQRRIVGGFMLTDYITVIQFIWPIVGGAIGGIAWVNFFQKKEQRLFKNIRRPISIISTEEMPMTHEARLLDRVGFFNVTPPQTDGRAPDLLNGSRLLILGYSPNSEKFRVALAAAKQREIPVIVYAGPSRITTEDMNLLQKYSLHSMCNTPLRLISDVFTLMGTYPEEKI